MKNQNELTATQEQVLQKYEKAELYAFKLIPEAYLNGFIEVVINKIYAILALSEKSRLTDDELSIFKGMALKKYSYYSPKAMIDAYVWALSETDLEIMRLDFRSFSKVLNAYKKHIQSKRMLNHNKVIYNPNQIEMKTEKMPEWFDKKYFERSAKIINKNRRQVNEALPAESDHYAAHIKRFKKEISLISDKDQLIKILEPLTRRSEMKEQASIVAKRIKEL